MLNKELFSRTNNQRGEVAWMLTVISMLVIGVGLFIGFQASSSEEAAIRTAPQAQEKNIILATTPAKGTPQACWPVTDFTNTEKNDPYCHAHLHASYSDGNDNPSDVNPLLIFNNVNEPTSFQTRGSVCLNTNSFIGSGPTAFATINDIAANRGEFWLSTIAVPEFVDTDLNKQVIEVPKDGLGLLRSASAIYDDEVFNAEGSNRDPLRDAPLCNYTARRSTSGGDEARVDRENEDNLVVFNIKNVEIETVITALINKVEAWKNANPDEPLDPNLCSLYIHYRSDDNKSTRLKEFDVYNIGAIDAQEAFKDIETDITIEGETKQVKDWIAELCNPTVTTTPEPEPRVCTESCTSTAQCGTYIDPEGGVERNLVCGKRSGSLVQTCEENPGGCSCLPEKCLGPSGVCSDEALVCEPELPDNPTITPTLTPTPPNPGACYDTCSTDAQCGEFDDPVDDPDRGDVPMRCLVANRTITIPGPSGIVPSGIIESEGAGIEANPDAGSSAGSAGHAPCTGAEGEVCRCMPPSCTGRDCVDNSNPSDPTLACERPEDPPEEPISCEYNALAFVEECTDLDPLTGQCTQTGNGRLVAQPIQSDVLNTSDDLPFENPLSWRTWGAVNNLQAGNPARPEAQKPSGEGLFQFFTASDLKIGSVDVGSILSRFGNFKFRANETEEGIGGAGMAAIDVNSKQDVEAYTAEELLTRDDILIRATSDIVNPDTGLPYPVLSAEQYTNGTDDATVKLYYNTEDYRIVPNGKKLYSCTNSLVTDGPRQEGIGACNVPLYEANMDESQLDTIHGLTVQCGQNIVYGWTLHKCRNNFDYIFVVDTSTTMDFVDTNLAQKKIEAVKGQLNSMIDTISASGTDSRVSIIRFNDARDVYKGDGRDVYAGDRVIDDLLNQQNILLRPTSNFADAKVVADSLTLKEGTCIKCGLDLANLVANSRSEEEVNARPAIVVLLSDGLPNAYPGDNNPYGLTPPTGPTPWGIPGVIDAANKLRNTRNKNVADDVLIAAIGYGDESVKVDQGQDFRGLLEKIANPGFAYSTDPTVESPISSEDLFGRVNADLNSCAKAQLAFGEFTKSLDINGDGIVNTIDLFLVYDNYYAQGEDLAEDVKPDGRVDALDVSLIIQHLGTVVNTDTATE